jgi:hypothetical protein
MPLKEDFLTMLFVLFEAIVGAVVNITIFYTQKIMQGISQTFFGLKVFF